MGPNIIRLVVVALVLTPLTAAAETSVPVLERKLRERDKVISELLDRVEVLERRIGVPRRAKAQTETDVPKPARKNAPGAVVVKEEDAERALERSLTREGAVLLPSGVLEAEPGLTYARQEDSVPSFITSGGLVFLGETERNSDRLTADLAVRLGLPWDTQLEVGLPYRWRQVETVSNVGFASTGASTQRGMGVGDLRVGLAKTLLREGLWSPDLVGRLTWDSDTGRASHDGVSLGGGVHQLRGSLSAIKRQDPVAFVGGLSLEHSFEANNVQAGPTASASFGGYVALSPETSLRLVLSGAYRFETELSGSRVEGSDQTIGTFIIGGSTLLATGTLLNLAVGIGLTEDASDFSLSLSLPIRFGGRLF